MNLTSDLHIVGLNTDKSRRDIASSTVYHLYFELSGYPLPEWGAIFAREWKILNTGHDASVDGSFLLLHSQLADVAATQLPALKRVVAATNEAYKRFAAKEESARELREEAWKQERNEVDTLAASLHFE